MSTIDPVREDLIKKVCKALGKNPEDKIDTSYLNDKPTGPRIYKIKDIENDALVYILYLLPSEMKPVVKSGDEIEVTIKNKYHEEKQGSWGKSYKMIHVDFEQGGSSNSYKSPDFSPSGKLLMGLKEGQKYLVRIQMSARGFLEWSSAVLV